MSAAFEIQLDRLPRGRSELLVNGPLALQEARPGDSDAAAAEVPPCRIQGELAIDSMGQKILVHGDVDVDRELDCHRCAQPSRQHYRAELDVLILRSPQRGPQESGAEDDAWVIRQQGGAVALERPLAEAVFLHEPQQVLCREDCQGVCPSCGTDRNHGKCECTPDEIDPRWDALRKLRDPDRETGDAS